MTQPQDTKTSTNSRKGLKRLLGRLVHFTTGAAGSAAKTLFSFLFLIIIFSLLGSLPLGESHPREVFISGRGKEKIVVFPLRGLILNELDPLASRGELITPEGVAKVLRHLKTDKSVRGVILDIDSPGGSAVASDRIYEALRQFRKETRKVVVVLMGDTVASGGYYISSASDKIVASPATITGSIGVIATNYKFMELFDKLGVRAEVYKKGAYKDILSSVRETTDEEKAIISTILDDAYSLFLDRVREGRNLPLAKVREIANGRIYSGREALSLGLVDSLGNLDKAVAETMALAKVKEARVVRLETTSFFSQLFSGFSLRNFLPFFPQSTSATVWYLLQ